ncbi:MAG: hypothetical protein KDK99_03045, partial [Verrucomicrobiales bacterium]|nr:hypothetical protein [Verrucomicrobiales bacterium]
ATLAGQAERRLTREGCHALLFEGGGAAGSFALPTVWPSAPSFALISCVGSEFEIALSQLSRGGISLTVA